LLLRLLLVYVTVTESTLLLLYPCLLFPPPRLLLPVLAVHNQEGQCGSEAKDHDTFHHAVVNVQGITARHTGIVVDLFIEVVVVLGVVLEEVVDPLAE
jgi:hypothetical protein